MAPDTHPRGEGIALIAFDVDGTLISHPEGKVIWELLNQRFLGDYRLNHQRYRDYLAGVIDYATWVALDVGGWIEAGATRGEIIKEVRALRPVDGAIEVLHELRARGYQLAVISGTLDIVLEEFFPEHPFCEVYTNGLEFDDEGRLTGWRATPFDMDGKARALEHLARLHDLPLSRCAFVGDNLNDLGVVRVAGFSVAFNPKCAELESIAHVVIRAPGLAPVAALFP
jgi:HAD superfamily phosphoserine phosphatase-like hydrolase